MSVEEFLENEQKILREMEERGKKALDTTGLVSKLLKLGEVQAGYIVYLTHERRTSDRIHVFSREVCNSLRDNLVLYGNSYGYKKQGNVHTTVATYDVKNIPSFKPDRSLLERLSDSAHESISDFLNADRLRSLDIGPVLDYSVFVHDDGTVVAEPTKEGVVDFYELRESVGKKASKRGIELKKSWGRHITVGRFTKPIPAEELAEFKELVENNRFHEERSYGDIDYCVPSAVSLNTGYFVLSNREFNLIPHSAFFFS